MSHHYVFNIIYICAFFAYTSLFSHAEWPTGTHEDKVRPILANYCILTKYLSMRKLEYHSGTYIYVPEIHPNACNEYHEPDY